MGSGGLRGKMYQTTQKPTSGAGRLNYKLHPPLLIASVMHSILCLYQ